MARRACGALAACIGWIGLACQSAPAEPPPHVSAADFGPCEELARVFFLIAAKRDRGESRWSQERMVRKIVENPFTTDPEQTRNDLLHVVELVYRSEETDPQKLHDKVLADCAVNDRGQAVLRTLWPSR